jgi:hypothetical protein
MTSTALARITEEEDIAVYSGHSESPAFRKIHRPLSLVTSSEPKGASNDLLSIQEIRPIPRTRDDVFLRSFQLLQQWEGQVKEVTHDSIVAVVSDKTNLDNEDEEVELDLAEIDPDDLYLVRPGSLFYWSVGYEGGRGIPRQRVSRIRFKRLPGITTRDIGRAKKNALKFATLFE